MKNRASVLIFSMPLSMEDGTAFFPEDWFGRNPVSTGIL